MPRAPRHPDAPSASRRSTATSARGSATVRQGLLAGAALGVVALAGVLTVGAPAGTPKPAAAVPAAPAPSVVPARAESPCADVTGCRVVDRVDVDGDRRVDQVGLAVRGTGRPDTPGVARVRVLTATGRTLSATVRNVWWFGRPAEVWAGATPLDGRPGAELVMGQRAGAHTRQFRVLTYRSGRLVTLASPTPPAGTGLTGDPAVWTVDGSFAFQAGIRRTASEGEVTLVLTTVERSPSGPGHAGWATAYRWAGSDWAQVSTTRVRLPTDAQAATVGGWHVADLPRFGRGG